MYKFRRFIQLLIYGNTLHVVICEFLTVVAVVVGIQWPWRIVRSIQNVE